MSAGPSIGSAYSGSQAPECQNMVHHISKRETLDHPPRGGKVRYRFSAFWLRSVIGFLTGPLFVYLFLFGQVLSTRRGGTPMAPPVCHPSATHPVAHPTMAVHVARPLTLIAALPQALFSCFSRLDLAYKLLTALNPALVTCLQFVPKRYVRITLKTFEDRQAVLQAGITIGAYSLTLFEADPVSVEVSIEHLPFEVTEDVLRDALSPFGSILDVCLQKFTISGVLTGTRILTMSLTSDIPVNLRVLRYPCRVFYRGQPRPCPICRDDGHRASSCPLRDKCRLCFQPGHFARDCEYTPPESEPVPDDPANDDDDASVSSADDGDDNASEKLDSGDEEVVGAVSAPAPPEPAAAPVAENPLEGTIASRVKRRVTGVTSGRFKWIARYPEEFRRSAMESGHTSDSHVIEEYFIMSDDTYSQVTCILDFGVNTFRVIKDTRTFEDVHLHFHSNQIPKRTIFPGIKAVNGLPLSPDITPLQFPGNQ